MEVVIVVETFQGPVEAGVVRWLDAWTFLANGTAESDLRRLSEAGIKAQTNT